MKIPCVGYIRESRSFLFHRGIDTTFHLSSSLMVEMAAAMCLWVLLGLLILPCSDQLQSSQSQTLLRLQGLLGYPSQLKSWNNDTDFCYMVPTRSVTVVCYDDSITQLHIIGDNSPPARSLKFTSGDGVSPFFSSESLFTTLARLPTLKVLKLVSLGLWGPLPNQISHLSSLEILNVSSNFFSGRLPYAMSLLTNLQTLILDDNMFSGVVPESVTELQALTVLSLRNNYFNGSLPSSLSLLTNLRVLKLSENLLYGEVPDISSLTNLQVLDLSDNYVGPQFPNVSNRVVVLILKNNKFVSGIPPSIRSYYQLQQLDISSNRFGGPFFSYVFALPAITYLNISGNMLTGTLTENMSCNAGLEVVDLSRNLLTGSLPHCLLSNLLDESFVYEKNCLANATQDQHPYAYCQNQAFAVGLSLRNQNTKESFKLNLLVSVLAGVSAVAILLGLLCFSLVKHCRARIVEEKPPRTLIAETVATGVSMKLLTNARYITQTMKMGALALPAYRTFALEELQEATGNFELSNLLGEGPRGQVYRGKLKNGSVAAIRCLKTKKRQAPHHYTNLIELISKLRHHHLVSALGHCFEYSVDDFSVSRIFLVFEFVPNGTLIDRISDQASGEKLRWTQRISAAISIAKGIQFLHAGMVPGIFGNDIKSTNILLDQDLGAKISSYRLPVLSENNKMEMLGAVRHRNGSKEANGLKRSSDEDKSDIYDFGVILLEIISGHPISSLDELNVIKSKVFGGTTDYVARKALVDPSIRDACSDESLSTIMELGIRCLSENLEEQPSIEDVLWNLQFAAQVVDTSRISGSPVLGEVSSPVSPLLVNAPGLPV